MKKKLFIDSKPIVLIGMIGLLLYRRSVIHRNAVIRMTRKSTVIKTCQMCKNPKSLSVFHRNRTKSDGHNGICKTCQDEVNIRNLK